LGENQLLSAQLSVTGLIKLFIPKRENYIYQGVNTLTGEIYYKNDNIPESINKDLLQTMIQKYIDIIRGISNKNYDILMYKLTEKLKQYKDKNENLIIMNSRLNDKKDGTIIQFNYLPVIQKIIINENEKKEKVKLSLSMKQLINIIKESINKDLYKKSSDVYNLILNEVKQTSNELFNESSDESPDVFTSFKPSNIKEPE
jgi:hypothetical protein